VQSPLKRAARRSRRRAPIPASAFVAAPFLVAAVLLCVIAAPAQAYRETNRCGSLPKDTRCYSGSYYYYFLNVRASLVQVATFNGKIQDGFCAKAINRNGLIRPGSTCISGGESVRACLNDANYDSRGYGSHSGGAFHWNAVTSFWNDYPDIDVAAATAIDTVGVCGR
jgi:hypothetical protein